MRYVTRYELSKDGTVKEINVPMTEVIKSIMKLLKQDREMLRIMAKL